eukprot:10571934-Heterocapsa_arctica.AAC.1
MAKHTFAATLTSTWTTPETSTRPRWQKSCIASSKTTAHASSTAQTRPTAAPHLPPGWTASQYQPRTLGPGTL